jgi:MoaA/NifB/PqqE/SkfB family radical SAM enzyme
MPHPPSRYRSLVPDLLFEDVLADRLSEIEPYLERPEAVDSETPLHRVTVFLTYHCNLECPYCKTITRSQDELRLFPHKQVTFTPEMFATLLQSWEDAPIRHLHFTGGEAALVRGFPEFVRQA